MKAPGSGEACGDGDGAPAGAGKGALDCGGCEADSRGGKMADLGVDFDASLIESAVSRAVRGRAEEASYHSERESVYSIAGGEAREAAFARLHARWFRRLGLDAPIRSAVGESSPCLSVLRRVAVVAARSAREEGAELFVTAQGEKSALIAIRLETLLDPPSALALLLRELLHLADMLDPSFAYEPRLPAHPAGPARDRLMVLRYRTAWAASVEGRLCARGRLSEPEARARCLAAFRSAFDCLGPRVERAFEALFAEPRPEHPALVALALDPDSVWPPSAGEASGGRRQGGRRCPLCRFPTFDFVAAPGELDPSLRQAIRSAHPAWRPEDGLCLQCADLYEARAVPFAPG